MIKDMDDTGVDDAAMDGCGAIETGVDDAAMDGCGVTETGVNVESVSTEISSCLMRLNEETKDCNDLLQ